MINKTAIYVLWLREMKRFIRAKSRIVGALAMPLFFLAFLGLGFRRMTIPGIDGGLDYVRFLVPGIIGMSILFSSTFAGLSVLWDREFGFLKEIMVAPVSRVCRSTRFRKDHKVLIRQSPVYRQNHLQQKRSFARPLRL